MHSRSQPMPTKGTGSNANQPLLVRFAIARQQGSRAEGDGATTYDPVTETGVTRDGGPHCDTGTYITRAEGDPTSDESTDR
jgi:hypothetical protein